MIVNATERLTEEIIVRGLIDTLRAHRYVLTWDQRREARDLLSPYVESDVVTEMVVAVGYFDHPDDSDEPGPGSDLSVAADYLFAHLCAADLMTIREALEVVGRGRGDGGVRRGLDEDADPVEPFSPCPRLVG
jgi:hypothetical protein